MEDEVEEAFKRFVEQTWKDALNVAAQVKKKHITVAKYAFILEQGAVANRYKHDTKSIFREIFEFFGGTQCYLFLGCTDLHTQTVGTLPVHNICSSLRMWIKQRF
jgi:hypothetical protein